MASEAWKKANQEKMKQYRRNWYARNKEKSIQKSLNKKKEIRNWLKDYKATLTCAHCPENHVACLDFHHLGDKELNIAQVVNYGWSIERIQSEIDKCIVLCSNCHRKEHYKG